MSCRQKNKALLSSLCRKIKNIHINNYWLIVYHLPTNTKNA